MVRVNLHNLVVVTALVLLAFFAMAKARKTGLGGVPIIGQILALSPVAG